MSAALVHRVGQMRPLFLELVGQHEIEGPAESRGTVQWIFRSMHNSRGP
jgi:hypothetical protein